MKLTKTWMIACTLVATPAIAMAQEEGTEGGEVGAEGTTEGGDGTMEATGGEAGGEAGGTEAAAPMEAPAAAGSSKDAAIFQRKTTVDASKMQFRVDLPIGRLSIDDGMGNSVSDTAIGLAIGAGYGINDKIEVGASYGLGLEEFEAKGPLSVYGRFNVLDSAKMQFTASAAFTYDINAETIALSLGGNFRYRLNDKMGIYTGAMQGNNYSGLDPISSAVFGLPGNQLSIGIDPNNTIALGVPVGFEFQAAPNVYASAQTLITNIAIKDAGDTTFIFADYIPLSLSAFYSTGQIDVGGTLSFPDIPDAADLFGFTIAARYHL